MRGTHVCPDCDADAVRRDGTGIWECRRCGHRFAGGTYRPHTPGGRTVDRSIRAALSADEEVPEAVEAAIDEAIELGEIDEPTDA